MHVCMLAVQDREPEQCVYSARELPQPPFRLDASKYTTTVCGVTSVMTTGSVSLKLT